MLFEEPTAATLISQALNTAHNIAIRTSELTAVSVLSGAVALALESAVAGGGVLRDHSGAGASGARH